MKIKIDNQWFELGKNCKRIAIKLTPNNKKLIKSMPKNAFNFVEFLPGDDEQAIREWIKS